MLQGWHEGNIRFCINTGGQVEMYSDPVMHHVMSLDEIHRGWDWMDRWEAKHGKGGSRNHWKWKGRRYGVMVLLYVSSSGFLEVKAGPASVK